MLVVRRIHLNYRLELDADADDTLRAAVQRAHDSHADHCPMARTVRDCVDITTELELVASA